jgi:release factor glutamine methyltransferase
MRAFCVSKKCVLFPPSLGLFTVQEAKKKMMDYFCQYDHIDNSHLTAQNLLTHVLGIPYRDYHQHSSQLLAPQHLEQLSSLCHRRAVLREPLQYLIGNWDFYGRVYQCRQPILIPRSETENLIERILNEEILTKIKDPKILDIGCGTGVIGLTLLAEIPSATAIAIDIAAEAIDLAALNCSSVICHNCSQKPLSTANPSTDSSPSSQSCCRYQLHHTSLINFFQSPVYHSSSHQTFDLIVSNPPYIPTDELHSTTSPLQEEVYRYESHVALDGGRQQGLEIIRDILCYSAHSLSPTGTKELWMEVHCSHPPLIQESYERYHRTNPPPQAEDPLAVCWKYFDFVAQYEDLFQVPRFVRFRKR